MTAPTMHRKPLGSRRTLHQRVTLDGADYDLCRPTLGEKLDVLSAAKAARELGPDRQPVDEPAGMMMIARIAVACLYHPGTATRVFAEDDAGQVKNEPWLEEIQSALTQAFAGPTLETAKGNSETTPS
ncbi:phage tail protein [Corallococcus praedator]|uniref:Phage tail protein n=1 Tax=Corallococcus praedator TaxID=2316724 RepID=A0ABX9QT63_9BACT|nr:MULTISPECIES: phage tail protein [Corallococcus]RKH34922.1 phage tail protein [Corallococcus sp. CA031C]RKI17122.1 phage tail protein [Corallococcus praedator]